MRNWLLGSSLVTAMLLAGPLIHAQSQTQTQGAEQGKAAQPTTQDTSPNGSGQAAQTGSGTSERSSRQEGAQEQRGTSEESRGEDRGSRSTRSNREEGGRRYDEGRRSGEGGRYEEGRRYEEGGRYDERRRYNDRDRYGERDRFEGASRYGDRYEGRRYEERRYGHAERDYQGPRNLQVTRRQRARVRDILVRRHVEPAQVDFPVRVGARVPEYVTSYDLPDEIYDYAPGYEGYRYFFANDEIVIVDPETMEIVAVMND